MISFSFAVSDDWMDFAACKGVDLEVFFCNENDRRQVNRAKDICMSCPVINECFELAGPLEHGIWAGMTSRERYRARRRFR